MWSAEFDWLGSFQGLAYVDGLDRSEVLGVCSALDSEELGDSLEA